MNKTNINQADLKTVLLRMRQAGCAVRETDRHCQVTFKDQIVLDAIKGKLSLYIMQYNKKLFNNLLYFKQKT